MSISPSIPKERNELDCCHSADHSIEINETAEASAQSAWNDTADKLVFAVFELYRRLNAKLKALGNFNGNPAHEELFEAVKKAGRQEQAAALEARFLIYLSGKIPKAYRAAYERLLQTLQSITVLLDKIPGLNSKLKLSTSQAKEQLTLNQSIEEQLRAVEDALE